MHFSRVKGRCPCRGPAARRWSCGARNRFLFRWILRFLISEDFARRATSLFSWTEAGHGPAPSKPQRRDAGRAEHETDFFSDGFSAFLSLKISPGGRPAYSAGPKQVTDLHLQRPCGLFKHGVQWGFGVGMERFSGFRPMGDQLIQLDRSRSRTCTFQGPAGFFHPMNHDFPASPFEECSRKTEFSGIQRKNIEKNPGDAMLSGNVET